MGKIETEYLKYFWPMRHYLVTCGSTSRPNIISISFCMPVSREPPLISCAVGRKAWSCELIRRTEEFTVNVPFRDMRKAVLYCGFHSGRVTDKFRGTGLTPVPGRRISVPAIGECAAHMECRLVDSLETGDKILFIGRVVEAYADEAVDEGLQSAEYASGSFPEEIYGVRFSRK